nr:MAG TPA: hypothetical protein [Caudoviricetes sp.]
MLTEPSITPPQVTRLFAFTIITCAAINFTSLSGRINYHY